MFVVCIIWLESRYTRRNYVVLLVFQVIVVCFLLVHMDYRYGSLERRTEHGGRSGGRTDGTRRTEHGGQFKKF